MKYSHTPKPWMLAASRWIIANGGKTICIMQSDDDWEEEQQANGRLIEAAPDLLEALILAAKELDINNPDPDLFDESETAGMIRAAISKATQE